ncbi:MAG TPA: PQQ-binding-like beta-propeller repeat protein [Planctomycetota bacterium]|nr:PQQ-binding-like beta-propeller repeat protein [Planctomycetota bacterium]
MKWMVPVGFALALAAAILVVLWRQAPPGGSAAAGKNPAPRTEAQQRGVWRTYHGTFALDGVADGALPDAPELLWKFKAGNRVDLTPVSADGRIYFTTAKGGLVALDLDGKPVWSISIAPDSFSSPPLLVDGLLIVGSNKGILHAYETAGGKEKWGYDLGGAVQGSPNRVGLSGGRPGVMAISPSDGSIHGVDLETGKGVWKTPGVERCDGSAGVCDGRIVMGSCASALHVYSEAKGEKIMDVPLGGDNQVAGGVALSGSSAFAGTRSGKLCAVDVSAGKILWTNSDGQGEAFMTPAVNDATVVFGADDGKVYGVRRDTGAKIWSLDTGNRPMSPVIVGERVVVSSGGSLFLLSLADGKKLWSAPVSDDITSPAVVGGRILVGGDDGTVSAYGRK